jgi:hypothetical protein
MPQHTTGSTGRRSSPGPRSGTQHDDLGDEVLAGVLIRMWTLASGRTLRRDVPPDQLSTEELIDFWADDMTSRSGRRPPWRFVQRPNTAASPVVGRLPAEPRATVGFRAAGARCSFALWTRQRGWMPPRKRT